ncbi:transcriptional antiterminator, BglG family /transcriptional regulator [Psychrobacillus sp. OK028]|uniref:BglG family transcription antiterminator n=1 Tax=Psychrobacillus sp. OK028 TaxID=1884359 RepID=UPI00088AE34F|nr:BglG family transcription antiterminator [Psychrobacillus sp. OK028]SDN61408.1 transcriptional antiterminator, BglG family /transcriptional regulator [Psychrobacillus sp. OK028]
MLEKRSLDTFYQLMKLQPAQLSSFIDKINLTERQFQYDVEKVNSFLFDVGVPPIKISGDRILIEQAIVDYWKKNRADFVANQFSFEQVERVIIFLLYTFIRQEPLSNFHFQHLFGVSKNTVSSDVKRVNKFCVDFRVEVRYSREHGYHLKGTEEDKRNLMLKAISMLKIKSYAHEKFTFIFEQQQLQNQYDNYQQVLKDFEQKYSFTFTEDRLDEFIYLLQMIHIRQQQQKRVQVYPDTVKFLENQQAFMVSTLIQQRLGYTTDREEVAFVTIQLLGICQGEVSLARTDALFAITEQIIVNFERYACVQLLDRTKAMETLYLHFKPAYYRMLFKIPITNVLLEEIKEGHRDLFIVVKEVLKPIEEMLNIKVPEDEVGFLTLHFGGLLKLTSESSVKLFRAIIVCPNGISSSLMLENQLKSLFPQYKWTSSFSSYDFQNLNETEYDLVFSTVVLKTRKPLFIIRPIMSEMEKKELVQTVEGLTLQQSYHNPTSDELMKIIRQYADIKQPELLKTALQQALFKNDDLNIGRKQPVLKDLLIEENIQFMHDITDWKDAIKKAAEPLLSNGFITNQYVGVMIENVETMGPYIIIGEQVAIPHARPEFGVKKLGMSLLKLSKPTYLLGEEQNKVDIFICLAAIDNETHLKALAQLTTLLSDPIKLELLKKAQTKQDILDLVVEFSEQ